MPCISLIVWSRQKHSNREEYWTSNHSRKWGLFISSNQCLTEFVNGDGKIWNYKRPGFLDFEVERQTAPCPQGRILCWCWGIARPWLSNLCFFTDLMNSEVYSIMQSKQLLKNPEYAMSWRQLCIKRFTCYNRPVSARTHTHRVEWVKSTSLNVSFVRQTLSVN